MKSRSMTSTLQLSGRSLVVPSFGLVLAILCVLTLIRLIGLKLSVVDLFFDESQYWAWSRELAFGYFTKPPLLAWIIAAAETVCGSSEACIRAPAPVLYLGTSLVIFAVAQHLYDDTVAFFAALSVALAPGLAFSARIMSTDVPLLLCWAVALLAYVKLLGGADRRWAIVLGVALGLGTLAKYAMLYFLLGMVLAAWLDRDARRLLTRADVWFALVIAALIIAPNVHWNFTNGFATFRHTGDNIQGGGLKINPLRAFEFLGTQFGLLGPILFAVLLLAIVRIASPFVTRADRLMLAFAIPPLALITGMSIFSRAFANWAATAYISAVVVVVAIMLRHGAWKWLTASLAIGVVAQVAFLAGDARATRLNVPLLGDAYRRTLGWRDLGEQTGRLARRIGARTIVGDQRDTVASLLYYWRDQPEQIYAWQLYQSPEHQFELTRALIDAAPRPILFVSLCGKVDRLAAQFATVEPLEAIPTRSGPTTGRVYYAFKLDNPRGPVRPLGQCR
jgi:4-amino-4-deoxy-L-arabinose transferase-like glycosyltransferase